MKRRLKAIMEADRRNYYGECAAFIAAIGEAEESREKQGAKQIYMEECRKEYYRRSAFKRELLRYGYLA